MHNYCAVQNYYFKQTLMFRVGQESRITSFRKKNLVLIKKRALYYHLVFLRGLNFECNSNSVAGFFGAHLNLPSNYVTLLRMR